LEPFKAHFESLPFCGRVEMLLYFFRSGAKSFK